MMDLLYICYDNKSRSKGLFDNTPTHAYDFTVKVTDLEIFNADVFGFFVENHLLENTRSSFLVSWFKSY